MLFLGDCTSLKLTASLPLKMDGWNTIVSFWGPAYFQGQAVSFGEGRKFNKKHYDSPVILRILGFWADPHLVGEYIIPGDHTARPISHGRWYFIFLYFLLKMVWPEEISLQIFPSCFFWTQPHFEKCVAYCQLGNGISSPTNTFGEYMRDDFVGDDSPPRIESVKEIDSPMKSSEKRLVLWTNKGFLRKIFSKVLGNQKVKLRITSWKPPLRLPPYAI